MLAQRAPRVLLGLLAGGGLAVAGAIFQALLRNPLATPHTLGVSAGGALGAVVAISFGITGRAVGPLGTVQFFCAGGLAVRWRVIYLLARRRETVSSMKLLLAGVTLGLICSAMIMFVRFIADPHRLVMVDRWLMGGLDVQGYANLAPLLPFLASGAGGAAGGGEHDEPADAGGGDGGGARGGCASPSGGGVSGGLGADGGHRIVAGPIGFVGLIVPHALRGLVGPDHRLLLVLCCLYGGAFLAGADTVARSAFAPSELPVGILTAIIGGPFFLSLLLLGKTPQ